MKVIIADIKDQLKDQQTKIQQTCISSVELETELKNIKELQEIIKDQMAKQWKIILWLLGAILGLSGIKNLPELIKMFS